MILKVLPVIRSRKMRSWLAYFIQIMVSLILLAITLWFAFLSYATDPLLHTKSGLNSEMLMVTKVTLVDNDGHPATFAVATLDNTQQALADERGIVYFEQAMLHDHTLNITYQNQHYQVPLHLHGVDNTVSLGFSQEMHITLTSILAALLVGWLIFCLVCTIKKVRQDRYQPKKVSVKFTVLFYLHKLKSRWIVTFSSLTLAIIIASLLVNPLSSQGITSAAGSVNTSLAVPGKVAVEQDDNNAILSWGDPIMPDKADPPNVTGYKISWGLAGTGAAPTVQLTSERTIQLQPLTNGQTYQAQVQSVDGSGNLSAPSQTVTFTGNPGRVNALRSRMTGFFDDFNRSAGAFDELKWNQAFSACNDPAMSSSFINAQFHAHDMELSGDCDRAQVVNRPRATFDFTGRTGTVVFDLDGLASRSIWYLDLIDSAAGFTDINSHISESGSGVGTPGNVLRIRQNENAVSFQYVKADGNISVIANTDWNPYPPLDWVGLKYIPNLRRHWELHVSQQKIEVTVNGKVVLAKDFSLPFSKATVHWTAFSYNTAKQNVPYALVHWDNFGFDGPAPTTETHNYRTEGYAGRDLLTAFNNSPSSTEINIPDKVDNALAQRLMFTLQMRNNNVYEWKSSDKVVINGHEIGVPKPKLASGVTDSGVNSYAPYSMVLNLPSGTLKTGKNQLDFVMYSSQMLNIHAELDFQKGSAPSYTQPSTIYANQASQVTIPMPEVGPSVSINKLNETVLCDYCTDPYTVSGKVQISATVNHILAMEAMGKNPGISKIQLRLNKVPIYELNLGTLGAPASKVLYNFDTTVYANGSYDLDIVAYNPSGAVSIPNYFVTAKPGDFYPIKIIISNSGNTPKGTPVITTAPTTTAAPVTATAKPQPTVTTKPTVAPTATPKPTVTAVPTTKPTVQPTATAKPTVQPTATPKPQPTATAQPPTPVTPTNWVMNSVVKVATSSGGSSSIVSRFTAPTKTTGSYILDVEVYDLATKAKVAQWSVVKGVSAEQMITLTNVVKLKAGSYIVKQGVFTTDWKFVAWQDGITFQVK